MADHHDGMQPHLRSATTLLVVSRAAGADRCLPPAAWLALPRFVDGSDFNDDDGVSFTPEQRAHGVVPYNYRQQPFPHEEAPGISVFVRDDAGTVFHSYSRYGRGVEAMIPTRCSTWCRAAATKTHWPSAWNTAPPRSLRNGCAGRGRRLFRRLA